VVQRRLIIDFNPAAERMFGSPRSEVGGKQMAELIVPPSLRDRQESAFLRHLATGESTVIGHRVELTGMRADGGEFSVELSITRGELSGRPFFTGYVRDRLAELGLEVRAFLLRPGLRRRPVQDRGSASRRARSRTPTNARATSSRG
jgi:PAS domain S-box-containing protein